MARDPDAIQREIEVTRAQLTEAIDLIAEKVSPKRVAARGQERAKALMAEAQTALRSSTQTSTVGADGQTYEIQRPLRADRVALVGGGVTVVAVLIVFVRHRRRRKAARRG